MGQWNEKVVFYLCTLLNIGRLQECTLLYDRNVHSYITRMYTFTIQECTFLHCGKTYIHFLTLVINKKRIAL